MYYVHCTNYVLNISKIKISNIYFPLKRHRYLYHKSTVNVILLYASVCMPSRAYSRVQWFWLFFTFWGITTHPWHPKGPRIWKLAKKIFQLHPWPAEIFGKNRKMRFFGLVSKFNFRSPVWQIFTIFSACFIYGSPNTYIKF